MGGVMGQSFDLMTQTAFMGSVSKMLNEYGAFEGREIE
jgi:hypothetical protein